MFDELCQCMHESSLKLKLPRVALLFNEEEKRRKLLTEMDDNGGALIFNPEIRALLHCSAAARVAVTSLARRDAGKKSHSI